MGKEGPDLFRSVSSEYRISGFLKSVSTLGCAFCNCTIRTFCTCLGRRRSIADFRVRNQKVIGYGKRNEDGQNENASLESAEN